MISDAAENGRVRHPLPLTRLAAQLQQWDGMPHSALSHHGAACCERARLWLLSMDASLRGDGAPQAGPRWLRMHYQWGPTIWPLHWCDAVRQKALDCGALAWMTRAVYAARNVKAFPVQLVQDYSGEAPPHWAARWAEAGAAAHWLGGAGYVYHEACAVAGPGRRLRIWDPSAGWWVAGGGGAAGHGAVAALRLLDPFRTSDHPVYDWGGAAVVPGQWAVLHPECVNP